MARLPHASRYRRRNLRVSGGQGAVSRSPRPKHPRARRWRLALGLVGAGALGFLALAGHPQLAAVIAGVAITVLFFR